MTPGQTPPLLRFIRKVGAAEPAEELPDSHLLARFAAARDDAAFAALVQRHGPMVLGVCRRVLADAHAAEDAFQATFLVLARKAGSICRPERLPSWLYGVAYRTSLKARVGAARLRRADRLLPDRVTATAPAADDEAARTELALVLDEELSRLPEKYRAPLVICSLQAHTHEEAARRLGCPRGTLTTRLVRARALLRRRLTRRGIAWTSGCWTAGALPLDASAAVPPPLIEFTTKAAAQFAAAPATAAGSVSTAAGLAQGVLHAMFLSKLKLVATLVFAVGLAGAGALLVAHHALAQRPAELKAEDAAKAAPKDADKNEKLDKAKEDKEKLQGTWGIVSLETDGQDLTVKLNDIKFIFAGDDVAVKGGKELKGTFKLTASVTPRQIDIVPTDNKDRTMEGIYEFKGDELKLCLCDGKPRPTEFTTQAESRRLLVVLKREKP
jgi:RNA polymerase sigma-70 factor (ECF subfamily)